VVESDGLAAVDRRLDERISTNGSKSNQARRCPQFIFSGNSSVKTGLWCTVLMPAPPLLT